jgi:hypothetical protein
MHVTHLHDGGKRRGKREKIEECRQASAAPYVRTSRALPGDGQSLGRASGRQQKASGGRPDVGRVLNGQKVSGTVRRASGITFVFFKTQASHPLPLPFQTVMISMPLSSSSPDCCPSQVALEVSNLLPFNLLPCVIHYQSELAHCHRIQAAQERGSGELQWQLTSICLARVKVKRPERGPGAPDFGCRRGDGGKPASVQRGQGTRWG